MFEITPFPRFSWSFSRHKTLASCARKYGYDYYFSHNGWLSYDVEPMHQQVYRLKKLQSLPILFGQIVHQLIEQTIVHYVQTGEVSSVEELVTRARGQLNAAYIDSTRNRNMWLQKPNKYYMMQEVYYDGKLNPALVEEYKERMHTIFENFLRSETFLQLISNTKSLRLGEPEQFRSMQIDEMPVFVVMDFHYYDETEEKWVIVDWKTGGESDDDRQQLALYAYYVQEKYRVPLENIEVYNEYLKTGQRKTYKLTHFDIENTLHTFKRSIMEMKKYQADILTNEPIDYGDFKQTSEEWQCIRCNYKELCLHRDV